jgi:hypothetical protein
MNGEPWTPAEDAQLKHLYEVERKTSAEIATVMPCRSRDAVRTRIQVLDLVWLGRRDGWLPDQDAELTRLWMVERLTGSQIIKHFPDKSRNAIIARVHRLGLVRVLAPDDHKEKYPGQPKLRAERRPSRPRNMLRFGNVSIPKSVIPAKMGMPEKLSAEPVTLLDRASHQCGWPINDGAPFLYCGAVKSSHKRYCDHHAWAGVARGRAAA